MSGLTSIVLPFVGAKAGQDRHASALEEEVVQLFDQYRERLLLYLLTFGIPVADCEEVVQETFLALFQHLQRGGGRQSLRGWLFRVSHNLALKRRQIARRESHQSDVADLIVDPAPNPEDRVAIDQTQQRLLAVVRALPERYQRCLALRAEGLRYREIAQVLNMSLGSVASCLERSLARIARVTERGR